MQNDIKLFWIEKNTLYLWWRERYLVFFRCWCYLHFSRERLEEWAKNDTPPSGGTLGQWIYKKQTFASKQDGKKLPDEYYNNYSENNYTEPEFIDSLTPYARQKYDRWRTPTEFPCVPTDEEEKTLENYLKN